MVIFSDWRRSNPLSSSIYMLITCLQVGKKPDQNYCSQKLINFVKIILDLKLKLLKFLNALSTQYILILKFIIKTLWNQTALKITFRTPIANMNSSIFCPSYLLHVQYILQNNNLILPLLITHLQPSFIVFPTLKFKEFLLQSDIKILSAWLLLMFISSIYKNQCFHALNKKFRFKRASPLLHFTPFWALDANLDAA